MVLPRVDALAEQAPLKTPALSVDDILAQARGGTPKAKDEGTSSAGSTPMPSKKKRDADSRGPDEMDKMVSFKSQDNAFSGFVILQGWNCVEAELMVQFQHHHRNASNGTYEIEIRSSRPWRFAQLQNCYLHVEQAIELCETNDENNLYAALDEVRMAQEELLFPQTRSFPADTRVFHPRLPADVLVDFCIMNQNLQAQAVLVRSVNAKDAKPQPQPLSLAQLKPGDHFSMGPGRLVEVLELARVECELPKLQKCFVLLSKIMTLLNAGIHNFEALN